MFHWNSNRISVEFLSNFGCVQFSGPRGNTIYTGFHVEGGCIFTRGDHRQYDKATGIWDKRTPERSFYFFRGRVRRGPGAIQVLARCTYLDLVSGTPTLTPASGGARAGIQSDVTLGLNWYLNTLTHFMVNYMHTDIDSVVPGASRAFSGLGCRLQFDF